MRVIAILLAVLVAGPVLAQSSASYNLSEHTFNAGGHPDQGTVMTSASYRVSLDSIGESIAGRGLSSRLYNMDASFGFTYGPAGEVEWLRFTDHETLVWDAEKSVGVYNLYRGPISGLAGLGYGSCEQHDLTGETATDTDTPPSSDGYFYLATAENRLFEEGTKGQDSGLTERSNSAPCP